MLFIPSKLLGRWVWLLGDFGRLAKPWRSRIERLASRTLGISNITLLCGLVGTWVSGLAQSLFCSVILGFVQEELKQPPVSLSWVWAGEGGSGRRTVRAFSCTGCTLTRDPWKKKVSAEEASGYSLLHIINISEIRFKGILGAFKPISEHLANQYYIPFPWKILT